MQLIPLLGGDGGTNIYSVTNCVNTAMWVAFVLWRMGRKAERGALFLKCVFMEALM